MEKKKKLHFIRFYNSQNRETISVADSTHSNKQCRRPLKPLDVLSNAKKKKKKTKMQRKKSDLNYVSCLKVALKVPKHARCLLSFSCTFCASSSVFHFFMMCLFFSVFSLLFRLVCAIRTFFFFVFFIYFSRSFLSLFWLCTLFCFYHHGICLDLFATVTSNECNCRCPYIDVLGEREHIALYKPYKMHATQ